MTNPFEYFAALVYSTWMYSSILGINTKDVIVCISMNRYREFVMPSDNNGVYKQRRSCEFSIIHDN